MNLIDQLEVAVAKRDKSKLAELEAQAAAELAPLRKSGQKVYVKKVEGLLSKLRKVSTETFARSPQDFAPKVQLPKPSGDNTGN